MAGPAKNDQPEQVGHYRSITVLSFQQRVWSTLAAKHCLRQIRNVDPFLFGSTTGGRAAMVWRHALEVVEFAHRGDQRANRFFAGLVKACNALPRLPALTAAKFLGVDQGSLRVCAGALAGFRQLCHPRFLLPCG